MSAAWVTLLGTGRGEGSNVGGQQLLLLWFISYQVYRCKLATHVEKTVESSDILERRTSLRATENFQKKPLLKLQGVSQPS